MSHPLCGDALAVRIFSLPEHPHTHTFLGNVSSTKHRDETFPPGDGEDIRVSLPLRRRRCQLGMRKLSSPMVLTLQRRMKRNLTALLLRRSRNRRIGSLRLRTDIPNLPRAQAHHQSQFLPPPSRLVWAGVALMLSLELALPLPKQLQALPIRVTGPGLMSALRFGRCVHRTRLSSPGSCAKYTFVGGMQGARP